MIEIKRYCDMCKKEIKEEEIELHILDSNTLEQLKFDLCEECKDELVKLLETKRER